MYLTDIFKVVSMQIGFNLLCYRSILFWLISRFCFTPNFFTIFAFQEKPLPNQIYRLNKIYFFRSNLLATLWPVWTNCVKTLYCRFQWNLERSAAATGIVFYKKSCPLKFCCIHEKAPILEPETLLNIKKRLRDIFFPVNIAKFLRTVFLKNICKWLIFGIKISSNTISVT